MQQVIFQQASVTQLQPQSNCKLPGHGTGVGDPAVNDEIYHGEDSPLWMVLSVLANVLGGSLLLYGMFSLPHVIATILS